MELQSVGFYSEYRKMKNGIYPSIKEFKMNNEIEDFEKIVDYLKNGVLVSGMRHIEYCCLSDERIGPPMVYTDGSWVWTTEFVHHLETHKIEVPVELINHIKQKNFLPKKDDEIGNELTDFIFENY